MKVVKMLVNECTCMEYKSDNFIVATKHYNFSSKKDKEVIDIDFSDIEKKKERIMKTTVTCKKCGGKMVLNLTFTESNVTGTGVILNALFSVMKNLHISVYDATGIIENIFRCYYEDKYKDFFYAIAIKYLGSISKTLYVSEKGKVKKYKFLLADEFGCIASFPDKFIPFDEMEIAH